MTEEQSLFLYGLKARGVQFAGFMIIILGIILMMFHWIFLFIGFGIGIILFFKGKAMRFQYQMQSGSIIHRGDW